MDQPKKYDVFISYSRRDAKVVGMFVDRLLKEGFSVWIDKDGIESGDAFKHVIVKAIERSAVVLFFSSEASNASEWTSKEIGVAIYDNKPNIPIRLDNAKYNSEIKFDLINLDYIDLKGGNLSDEVFARLVKTLRHKCGKSSVAPVVEDTLKPTAHRKSVSATLDRFKQPFGRIINIAAAIIVVLTVILYIIGSTASDSSGNYDDEVDSVAVEEVEVVAVADPDWVYDTVACDTMVVMESVVAE